MTCDGNGNTGTTHGENTFTMGSADVALYAWWKNSFPCPMFLPAMMNSAQP